MTAQKGKDLLLTVDSDGEGSFTHRGGLAGAIARLQRGNGGHHRSGIGRPLARAVRRDDHEQPCLAFHWRFRQGLSHADSRTEHRALRGGELGGRRC